MKDNKELKALSDEELQDISGGKLSAKARDNITLAGIAMGAGLLLATPFIGIGISKAVDKKKDKKLDNEANNFDYDSLDYSKDPTLEDCNNNPKILAKARNRYFMEHKDEPGFTRDYTPWT